MANLDNYLSCEQYAGASIHPNHPGFNAWFEEDTNHWYFAAITNKGNVQLRSEAYTTESARDNGIESVMKNRNVEERYKVIQDEADGKWYIILKAGNHQEIARSCAYDSETAATAGIKTCFSTYTERNASAGIIDNYLDCEAYAGAPASEKYSGFNTWHDADSNHWYFAVTSGKGNVTLRSEAYTTESARNNGIESVMKNRELEERYKIIQDEAAGKWYVILKAGNHQEIARSCAYDSESAAKAGMKSAMKGEAEKKSADYVIEDYLPCEAYAGKDAVAKYPGFTQFQEETSGLYFFAQVDKDGKVVLKSEGYKTTASRDNGIESVMKNRDIEERWSQEKDDDGYYMSLRAGNRQEIARTCHFSSEGALLGWWMPFTATGLAWGKSAIAAAPIVAAVAAVAPTVVVPPPPVVVTVKKDIPTPPPVTTYREPEVAAAVADGGSNWWKWLLPLLLLGALFLLWKQCGGCNKAAVKAPAVSVAPVVPKDTVKAVVTPPPPPAPTCKCDGPDPLYNLTTSAAPKSLSRLGTNPEFGNSHDLSPTEFYDKLQNCAKNSSVDKKFLDRVFKGMGYTDGFAAAKSEMFSAVEIAPGTVGNIGYSKQHKTLYARLDTQGKDLLAFRIKSANGCDMHFMKTCGNHFFYCGK